MSHLAAHEIGRRDRSDDWLTPRDLVDRLGPFDLDPCASSAPPWPTAVAMISPPDDGLSLPWWGRVWCNPPYSQVARWVKRCADHRRAVALVFARVETEWWWRYVWHRASSVFFLRGRLRFQRPENPEMRNHSAGAPSAIVTWSMEEAEAIAKALGASKPWPAHRVDLRGGPA